MAVHQEIYANNASSFLSGSLSNSATSLSVTSATGFPATGNFRVVIDNELLLVTAVSGTTFTVTRGIEGTTAVAHSSGAPITAILTAQSIREVLQPVSLGNLTVPPAIAGWSWLNQGSATLTDNGRTQTINSPGSGNVTNIAFAYIAAPATPYIITALFFPTMVQKDFIGFNFGWTDGTKLALFQVLNFTAKITQIASQKYTSTTVYSADYANANFGWSNGVPYWLQIADDGANRICSFSGDGITFSQFHSVGDTDFLTPTGVGWGVYTQNALTPNFPVAVTLASWLQH